MAQKKKFPKIIKPSEFLRMTPAQRKKIFKKMAPTLNYMFEENEKRGGFQDDWDGQVERML